MKRNKLLRFITALYLVSLSIFPALFAQNKDLRALSFNGKNSTLEFPSIPFDTYKTFTTEAWVLNWSGYIFSQGPFGDPENSVWMATGNDYYSCGWESGQGKPNHEYSIGLFDPGKWVHVAMVFDGVNQLVFVQGKVKNSKKAPIPGPLQRTRDFTIGAEPSPGPEFSGNFGSGMIKSLRISNKARYSANFDPPTGLINDKNTVLLVTPESMRGKAIENIANDGNTGIARNVTVIQSNKINSLVLRGLAQDQASNPLNDCAVRLHKGDRDIVSVRSNSKGEFQFILNDTDSEYEITAVMDTMRRTVSGINPVDLKDEVITIRLLPSLFQNLRPLGFLVGDWFREDKNNEGQSFRIETSYHWGANGNTISRSWKAQVNGVKRYSGDSIIYWDPVKKELASIGFDWRGNHYSGVLTVDKGQVTDKTTRINQDGETTSTGSIVKPVNNKTHSRQRTILNSEGNWEPSGQETLWNRIPKFST